MTRRAGASSSEKVAFGSAVSTIDPKSAIFTGWVEHAARTTIMGLIQRDGETYDQWIVRQRQEQNQRWAGRICLEIRDAVRVDRTAEQATWHLELARKYLGYIEI